MKYIRTKDGIFKVTSKAGNIYCVTKQNNEFIIVNGRVVEKEADTIEELCDEFVIKSDDGYLHAKYYRGDKTFYVYNTDEEVSLGECLRFNYIIYGAIWTNKGLIYVAKMNDKGELDLL